MDNDVLRIARDNARWASRALLAHTLCCPSCSDRHAFGGELGHKCAGGKMLRLAWANLAEQYQLALTADDDQRNAIIDEHLDST